MSQVKKRLMLSIFLNISYVQITLYWHWLSRKKKKLIMCLQNGYRCECKASSLLIALYICDTSRAVVVPYTHYAAIINPYLVNTLY